MKKNEVIALAVYLGCIVVLCLVFPDWWILIAVLALMALMGYMKTRYLVNKFDK